MAGGSRVGRCWGYLYGAPRILNNGPSLAASRRRKCLVGAGTHFTPYWQEPIESCLVLGYVISGVITSALLISLFFLINALPRHEESASALLRSAVILWLTNIVVFGLWYWRLDAGGPHLRWLREVHTEGSFLFPQMTQYLGNDSRTRKWTPDFIDYLFIAFNTATAFSPTDTPVLSKWAKILSMLQATISLAIVAVLVSRGIGLL